MTRQHDLQLWSFASKELELGEHRYVEAHLEDCPECTEQLAAIQVAKEALDLARVARPGVTWSKVDQRVGDLVEQRLGAQARGPWLRQLKWTGSFALAVAVAVVVMMWPKAEPTPLPTAVEQSVPISSWARVDRAEGLSRVGAPDQGTLDDGSELHGGDVIRTSKSGKAFVHLPDRSHLRVGASSQLALTRSEADDVALTLERGSLAVRASHQVRKGFVVHTGGLSVLVLGTVFGVTNDSDVVEVSVSEGKVRVELPNGEQAIVEPGQRLRFDTKAMKARQLKVTAPMERQLAEVAAADDAATGVEGRAMVAAVGGAPSSPPMLTAQGTPRSLPRLSAAEARARQVNAPEGSAPAQQSVPSSTLQPEDLVPLPKLSEAPKAAVEQPKTEVIIEAPPEVWPSLGGGEVIRGVPPRRETASESDEWNSLPKPTPVAAPAPAPAPVALAPASPQKLGDEPKDLETVFLTRAEEGVAKGECDRYLVGLEEIALDAQRDAHTEQARILRARCFDVQMRPRQSMSEYRKYADEYPRGRFLSEARRALGN